MKRFVVTFAIVFGITGALWLRIVPFPKNGSLSRQAVADAANRTQQVPATTADPTHIAENDSETSDRDDVVKIRQMIEAHNVAINFWGKVVDQDGLPLPEVRVDYTYSVYHGNDQGVAWIDLETKKGATISDGDGLFAITDLKGHDLTIETLTRSGYVHRERWQLAYEFFGKKPGLKFEPRRDKPVRITMIQRAVTEPLVHVKGAVEVRGNGPAAHWNLWSGEADPDGELSVIFKADPGVSAKPSQVGNWSLDLQIAGGGIIEAPWDEDVRRAPESGYSATVAYPKVEQEQGSPLRSFYLRTVDGKYGRLQVDFITSLDGRTADCYFTGDMNPRPGSRNLESAEDE